MWYTGCHKKIHLPYICGGYKRLNIINMTSLLLVFIHQHISCSLVDFLSILFYILKIKNKHIIHMCHYLHCLNISLTIRLRFLLDLVAHFWWCFLEWDINWLGCALSISSCVCLFNSSSSSYPLFLKTLWEQQPKRLMVFWNFSKNKIRNFLFLLYDYFIIIL